MYSIPEDSAAELIAEREREKYSEMFLAVTETNISSVKKKVSSTSLPDNPLKLSSNNLNRNKGSGPILVAPEMRVECYEEIISSQKEIKNRLSKSLIEFSQFGLTSDSGASDIDKRNLFANMASHPASSATAKSYLEVNDCISNSNQEPEYEKLLSSSVISESSTSKDSKSTRSFCKGREFSDNLVVIDLNEDSEVTRSAEDSFEPIGNGLRQRSRSMQWIQNTFQNVSSKYKYLLEFRRPSDIVEDRMRNSKEELEMDEPQHYEVPHSQQSPTAGGRRFSENVIGKQKRFPFSSPIGHLKDLWKERNLLLKRQEEKDCDQHRSDVCPLFNFPRKYEEDELILDALRQAMRKCTAVDPDSRPTSTLVLDQLSKLLN